MAKIDVVNLKGEKVGDVDLSDEVFATEIREHLFQEDAPLAAAVDEVEGDRREAIREHDPRKASTGAEISPVALWLQPRERLLAVREVEIQRTRSDQVHAGSEPVE